MYTLANCPFPDQEGKALALGIVQLVLSAGNVRNQQNTLSRKKDFQQKRDSLSKEKVAHNVAMSLNDADQKFSGDLGRC